MVRTNTLAGHEVIPFFDQSREEYLEYDLTSMVDKLSVPQKPKLGILSTLPLEAGAGGIGMSRVQDPLAAQEVERAVGVVYPPT